MNTGGHLRRPHVLHPAVGFLAAAGFLITAWLKAPGAPAHLRVETGQASLSGDRFEIPDTVFNDGQSAAANVQVSSVIGENGIERESGFTVDFVPPGGKRTGSVSFTGSGLLAKTVARVVGFTEPQANFRQDSHCSFLPPKNAEPLSQSCRSGRPLETGSASGHPYR